MENKFENIDDVIARFLSGEATADDHLLLQEWRGLNDENDSEFLQFEKLFSVSGELKEILPVDTDAAWEKVKNSLKLSEQTGKVISLKPASLTRYLLRFAATLLILAGAGLAIYFMLSPANEAMTQLVSIDSVKTAALPDGSSITLNRNSQVEYASDHFTKKRIVKLRGEAFFNVIHNDAVPFVVEAGDLTIRDVGTTFNVKAVAGENLIVVSVTSGEVSITTVNNESISLHKGEEARYVLSSKSLEKVKEVDLNVSAYTNRIFVFENAELSNAIRVLNEVYSNRLALGNEQVSGCRITVTFDNESVEEIVSVISETLGLQVKVENQQFIFSGNGCK